MPRTKTNYTIVTIEAGNLETTTYSGREALEDALKNLSTTELEHVLLFNGAPVEFDIKTETVITFGDKPKRTPRNDEPTVQQKRKRRTKIEMAAARALEAANGNGVSEVNADHE